MLVQIGTLTFKTIDLSKTSELCIRFREDSFMTSFGSTDRFHEEDNKGSIRYIEWLQKKILDNPYSAVHIWESEKIIGQIELGSMKSEPDCGYVNLFYLIREKRGKGLSKYLDLYTSQYFQSLALKRMKLSVSPTNIQAVKFYEKSGWRYIGPRPGHPEVNFMEKSL